MTAGGLPLGTLLTGSLTAASFFPSGVPGVFGSFWNSCLDSPACSSCFFLKIVPNRLCFPEEAVEGREPAAVFEPALDDREERERERRGNRAREPCRKDEEVFVLVVLGAYNDWVSTVGGSLFAGGCGMA